MPGRNERRPQAVFEPDLNELEERVSEMGEMLRDLGGMVQKCRALNIDAADALMDARDVLNREFQEAQEDLDEVAKREKAREEAEYRNMVLPI